MKKRFNKIVTALALAVVGVLVLPTQAYAATVDDEGGFFPGSSFVSELETLEAERGLNVAVTTFGSDAEQINASAEADELRHNSGADIAVIMVADTNQLGVSYSENVSQNVNRDTLEKIVDKEMIPAFLEGEYAGGVLNLVSSVNLMVGDGEGSVRPSQPGVDGWFAENSLPLAVAGISFLLFFSIIVFFIGKRGQDKASAYAESLGAEKVRRAKEVQNFWDFVDDSIKERFVEASNKEEREVVISEVFDSQTFADDSSRLSNLVGSFIYPGKIEQNVSIKHFLDAEERTDEIKKETFEMWDGLGDEQREAFRSAGSETHQEALALKFFPILNPVETASRFRVLVPDARSTDPNYVTYVEEKIEEGRRKNELKKKKPGFISKMFGLGS